MLLTAHSRQPVRKPGGHQTAVVTKISKPQQHGNQENSLKGDEIYGATAAVSGASPASVSALGHTSIAAGGQRGGSGCSADGETDCAFKGDFDLSEDQFFARFVLCCSVLYSVVVCCIVLRFVLMDWSVS